MRHFSAEDFSVGVSNHEDDVKRLEQDRSDTEKSQAQMSGARRFGTLADRGMGPGYAVRVMFFCALHMIAILSRNLCCLDSCCDQIAGPSTEG